MARNRDVFTRGGESGALIAAKDWSLTPLGDPAGWSASLRAMVSTCLASRYPMFLWWGPQLINIYNDAYAPLMGSKHPEGMGRPAWEVWAEIWDIVGPLATGVIEHGEATWSEAQRLDLERSGYAEETYFDFAYSPVLDDDGSVAGILGVVSEITERVLSARRLRTLSDIAAHARGVDGVAEVARETVRALDANADDLPFALLCERAGDRWRLLAATGIDASAEDGSPRDQPKSSPPLFLDDALDRALRAHEPVVLDPLPARVLTTERAGRPDADKALLLAVEEPGERGPALVLCCGLSANRALDDELRQFCGLVGAAIGSAIADARALEEERARARALTELDRAKTEFFSNVSHEFRTPLTLLLGPLEDAVRRPDPDPELVMAHRNALRLLRHVNALLEYSRLQAQQVEAQRCPIDLAGMCSDLAGVFRSAVEKAGLTLEVECLGGPVPVLADPHHLEQIVLNLLSNALKFTFEGKITVRVYERDGYGAVDVSDTGVGIPEADLGRMFERFHRVQGTRSRSHEGSGIGLALSRELTELQGGTLEALSGKGEGTTFTVALPLAPAAENPIRPTAFPGAEAFVAEALRWSDDLDYAMTVDESAEQADARPAEADASRARVLVVDDNADMRSYLAHLLGRRYELRCARDGEQALDILRGGPPIDLVLSDVMMPRVDGFGLLRAIRADRSLAGTPVVLLSARAGEEAAVEGLASGADDYVVKPFTARELLARVAANLELGAMRNREAQRASEHAQRLGELLEREHGIAVTLQHSMLPDQLDVGAFTRVGARYEPASEVMQVGGDFYDALALPDGRVLLFIGDVAGHGLESAVVMGSIRAALRAYVLTDAGPDQLLLDLNAFALTRADTPMITCQCVVIDADGTGATYAIAGHPPGLLRDAGGRVALLNGAAGPPLGVQPLPHFPATQVGIEPGSTIVLYTDGLVERRREPLDRSIERLVQRVGAHDAGDPDGLADQLLAEQRQVHGYDDDVAILIATFDDPGRELGLTLPAGPQALQRLRRTMQRWLAANSVCERDAYDIVFAANEAAANVVEHAYGLRQGEIQVTGRAEGGQVEVEVSDTGRWRPPRADGGGRGLQLMDTVMDEVELRRSAGGSTVHMAKQLSGSST